MKLYGRVNGVETEIPGGGGAAQVQSDWNQSDNTAVDYIKNKPTLGTAAAKNSTNAVTVGSTAVVESGAVYGAINDTIPLKNSVSTKTANTKLDTAGVAVDVTWTGLTSFYGSYVWTDGTNIYYSSGSTQYVLDKSTSTWSAKTWMGLTSFNGNYIWTDGDNIYYSGNSKTSQYILNKSTSTWSAKTWTGITSIGGTGVWTDGTNIYYSSRSNQYVLDKSASTWSVKTWTGLTSFNSSDVWTDGDNVYYSYNGTNKKLITKQAPKFGSAAYANVPTSGDASSSEVVLGNDSRLTNARTPTSHTHTTSDISNFPTLGTAAALDVATSGNASSSQVVKGNDSRLTDARTPTAHSHDAATTSAAGFMSTTDKTKLNGIASNATANTILTKTVNLASTDWTGASAPYSQTVSVSDILSTDTPFVDVSVSDTAATGIDQIEQFGYISKATTGSGSMTFYCYEEKPDINLTVNIKVVR